MGASAWRFEVDEARIGVLAEAFPLETVRAILRATGREGKRKRLAAQWARDELTDDEWQTARAELAERERELRADLAAVPPPVDT